MLLTADSDKDEELTIGNSPWVKQGIAYPSCDNL